MNKIKELYRKYGNDFIAPTAVMLCICLTVALALAITNKVTAPKISEISKKNIESSMKTIIKAESYSEKSLKLKDKTVTYYLASSKGEEIGYIFITEQNGYGGAVSVMTAVNTDGSIKAAYVLDASDETQGLGKNVTKKEFYSQFADKSGAISVVKNNPNEKNNEIQAVTGATITSKAVARAVNEALTYAESIISEEGNANG